MLTIPRLVRNTFKFDRALLGELYHAADREPVFWPDGAGQSTPDDAYVQADAPDCAIQPLLG